MPPNSTPPVLKCSPGNGGARVMNTLTLTGNRNWSPVARSLAEAFVKGEPWSPRYHAQWLANTDASADAGVAPEADAPAQEAAETLSIDADDLYALLVVFNQFVVRR